MKSVSLLRNGVEDKLSNSTHIAWSTGDSMVSEQEMKKYYNIGKMINGIIDKNDLENLK